MAWFKRPYSGKRVDKQPSSEPDTPEKAAGNRFAAWWRPLHWGWKAALITVASLAVIALTLVVIVKLYIRPPDDTGEIKVNDPTPSGVLLPPGESPDPNNPVNPTVTGKQDEPVKPQYIKREGVYTFLLLGINEGLTDTIMVATLDTVQGTCAVLSIPRDTVIGSANRTGKKINGAYSQQKNVDEPGIEQVKREVATLIGFQPQYAAVVNYNGFKRLIEAIKGVDFYVPRRMYKPSEGIDLQKGQQHLDADQALQLVRYRVDEDGKSGYDDYGRIKTQQQFLAAAAKKAMSNWTNFLEYIDIARDNLKSDIDWGNIAWLAGEVNKIGIDNVVFSSLPTYTVVVPRELEGAANHYMEVVRAEEALALINETINPFTIDIGAEIVEYTILTEK